MIRAAFFSLIGLVFVLSSVVLGTALTNVPPLHAQSSTAESSATDTPLVFDGVTVIDVRTGERHPAQRVVITGTRITAVGAATTIRLPAGARVVNARGKYLIPGLWDMHLHTVAYTDHKFDDQTELFDPLLIANGITGIRIGWSPLPFDSTRRWQHEILAGTRVGPPRQLIPGPALDECARPRSPHEGHACVVDPADAKHVVDSLKAVGASFIKTYGLERDTYLAVAAEARKLHLPFGGHLTALSAAEASDSGATFIDHLDSSGRGAGSVFHLCVELTATADSCGRLAATFRRNNTWFLPTMMREALARRPNHRSLAGDTILARFEAFAHAFWSGTTHVMDLQHGPFDTTYLAASTHASRTDRSRDSSTGNDSANVALGFLRLAHQVGLPILAGTDDDADNIGSLPPGFTLQAELALYVAEGLTPLEALQTATLNPARALHATDSLGTIAPGKLADLVLLDADPLTNIANLAQIRAVVANGHYYDRAALDHLIATLV
jgi:hypothetical protein